VFPFMNRRVRLTSPTCPWPSFLFSLSSRIPETGPYKNLHKKQRLALQILHGTETEGAQHASRSGNSVEREAQEGLRERLRPSSVLENERVHYQEILFEMDSFRRFFDAHRPKDGPQRAQYDNRLAALKARRAEATPHRYEDTLWMQYRSDSIDLLKEYYPESNYTISYFIFFFYFIIK
jgi:hypothetical protein